MKCRQWILLFIITASSVQGQTLSVVPHYNLSVPTCRLTDKGQGYDDFSAVTFLPFSGNLGVFLEYKSKEQWSVMSGISIGAVGIGYSIPYETQSQTSTPLTSVYKVSSNDLYRVPVLFAYTWKRVHLFALRNYRKPSARQRAPVADESILYALVFKVQPMLGVSVNYIGQLSGWDKEDTLSTPPFTIYQSTKQLSGINVSAMVGVRLQFYSFGKDKLALTVLYHQGLQDLLEMDVDYTLDGQGSYDSQIRSRGSGLSVTLSYPIRVYNFNKQERELSRQK